MKINNRIRKTMCTTVEYNYTHSPPIGGGGGGGGGSMKCKAQCQIFRILLINTVYEAPSSNLFVFFYTFSSPKCVWPRSERLTEA